MIEVQHLTKRYGRVTAVDDVSFRVERGEILGFLGPNGAGKTTTMRILTGYMPATEGKAIVAGFDVFDEPDRGQAAHRLPARNAAALPGHDGARVPRLRRAHQGRATGPSARRASTSVMETTHVADMADRHCVEALERLPAARRSRAGAHSQSRRADPRRADRGPRPEADHRDPRPHQGASPATTRSSSARTSCRKSPRPASASSSSTRAASSRWTRRTTSRRG